MSPTRKQGPHSIGLCTQLACIWEASARKAGNVHRFRDFEDASYLDFLVSAAAIAPVMETAPTRSVGTTILEAVRATRQVVSTNTNLGIVLLLAPLAAVPTTTKLRGGLEAVLRGLTVDDACLTYEAIRLANPGGLGTAPEQDIHVEPTQTLRQVMELAKDRDLIALQYTNGFAEVFDEAVPSLQQGLEQARSLEGAIIRCHLALLAGHPDSLIARKSGLAVAEEASRRARQVLDADLRPEALADFDAWLRSAGNTRNPGATADLVAAALFVALREGTIQVPAEFPWAVDS